MQDLRTAADLVARDLRRAGHWGDAAAGVWSPAEAARANPYAALAPAAAASDAASYGYSRDASENHLLDGNEQFGLRLRNKAIELQLGSGNWQALTDATLLAITAFTITPTVQEIDLGALCSQPCPRGQRLLPAAPAGAQPGSADQRPLARRRHRRAQRAGARARALRRARRRLPCLTRSTAMNIPPRQRGAAALAVTLCCCCSC